MRLVATAFAIASAVASVTGAAVLTSCHWPGFGGAAPETSETTTDGERETDLAAPQRSAVTERETYEQVDLLYDLRERVLELEIEIAEQNQSYSDIGFEGFLDLDPWNLATDQIYFLKHFCDNGDFTLSREAEILLLEREITRRRADPWTGGAAGASPDGTTLQQRLDAAISRCEQRVADLEKIAALYRSTTGNPIHYPSTVEPATLAAERRYVAERQRTIREEIGLLDDVIAELRAALDTLPAP